MKPYYVIQWRVIYNDNTYGWEESTDPYIMPNRYKTKEDAKRMEYFMDKRRPTRIIKRTDEVVRVKKGQK